MVMIQRYIFNLKETLILNNKGFSIFKLMFK